MKTLKTRFLALCGLMVLLGATLATTVAEAACPMIVIQCSSGDFHGCVGTQSGGKCTYNENCLNC
jgi:hypothetical protein